MVDLGLETLEHPEDGSQMTVRAPVRRLDAREAQPRRNERGTRWMWRWDFMLRQIIER